jgi:methionyl-tRNA synthetase
MKLAVNEAIRVVSEANKYLSEQAPWKLRDSDPERMRTIMHVALQAVSDCNTLLAPFLPHAAQQVHELLGRDGILAPVPELREVDDLDGGPSYPVLTGSYDVAGSWGRQALRPGSPVAAPTPLFAKLDPSVVDDELARMEGAAG